MFARARERGRFLMPGHILRFDPRYTLLKERLDAGDLGRLVSITAQRTFPRLRPGFVHRSTPFLEATIHDIDMALWLTGSTPARAYGTQSAARDSGGHDAVWGILHLADGTVALLTTHWLLPDTRHLFVDATTEVVAERAVCRVSAPAGALALVTDGWVEQPDPGLWPITHGQLGGALFNEIAYMVRCVRRGEPPTLITEEQTIAGLGAALALQESADRGEQVAVAGQT
jgi:predicted dehydrogenase